MTSLPTTPPLDTDTPIYDDLIRTNPELNTTSERPDTPSDVENPLAEHNR